MKESIQGVIMDMHRVKERLDFIDADQRKFILVFYYLLDM
jgi:hypothetical protein